MLLQDTLQNMEEVYLLQGAMETETQVLINQLKEPASVMVGNWKFHYGKLGKYDTPVIISRTYQGMINASAATALALSDFPVKAVINQGIAGGYDERLHTGDIVIGEKIVPMGAVMRPFRKAGEKIAPEAEERLPLEVYFRESQSTAKVTSFQADPVLVAAAERREYAGRKITGIIGSADEWNNELDRIHLYEERYGISCEDMESAAAAQICTSYGIPFIGIRILSNTIIHGEELDESQGAVLQTWITQFIDALAKQA